MKNLKNLGEILNKEEQQSINGGSGYCQNACHAVGVSCGGGFGTCKEMSCDNSTTRLCVRNSGNLFFK